MPKKDPFLRVLPNPFAFLDHEGIPAGTYPFDPVHHSPDRRWVGAEVDRSLAADGKPRTRHLPQPGDRKALYKPIGLDGKPIKGPDGHPVVLETYVDRAPRKRIVWAHAVALEAPHVIPDTPHYRLGIREGSLFPADQESAGQMGAPWLEPGEALLRAAKKAIEDWQTAYGEPPPVDDWPDNLRDFGEAALEQLEAPPQAAKALTAPAPGGAS